MNEAVVTTIAALGAALLTGGFSILAVWLHDRRQKHWDSEAATRAAYREVLGRSWSIVLRSGMMGVAFQQRSATADDNLRVWLRMRKPLDHFEIYDWLAPDWDVLIAAMSVVWTAGDQQGIALANAVVERCSDLMTMPRLADPGAWWMRLVRQWVASPWSHEGLKEREAKVRAVAAARRALAEHLREGMSDPVDVFAVAALPTATSSGKAYLTQATHPRTSATVPTGLALRTPPMPRYCAPPKLKAQRRRAHRSGDPDSCFYFRLFRLSASGGGGTAIAGAPRFLVATDAFNALTGLIGSAHSDRPSLPIDIASVFLHDPRPEPDDRFASLAVVPSAREGMRRWRRGRVCLGVGSAADWWRRWNCGGTSTVQVMVQAAPLAAHGQHDASG